MITIQKLIEFLIILTAYITLLPLVGYFQAWVAKKMGDTHAEEEGYLTLNPFVHAPVYGFILLYLVGFGFARFIPINPSSPAYNQPWRRLKLAIVTFSGVFAYIVLAIIALVGLVLFITRSTTISLSPFATSLAAILVKFSEFAIFFAILKFFWYGIYLLALPFVEEYIIEPGQLFFGMTLTAILLIYIFGDSLETVLTYGIHTAALFLVNFIKHGI